MLFREHFTVEFCKKAVEEYSTPSAAAKALHTRCYLDEKTPAKISTVRDWILKGLATEIPEDSSRINALLGRVGIPQGYTPSSVRASVWNVHSADKETGDIEIRDCEALSVVARPQQVREERWPIIQPAPPTVYKELPQIPKPKGCHTFVVLPDPQIGFLRDINDPQKLLPMHDEDAIDCALTLVSYIQPDRLIWLGDFLDLSEMSRWLQHEEFWRTTQPAIDEGHRILSKFEAAMGPLQHREPTVFIAGNHDRRLKEYVLKNARAALNIRRANDPDGTEVYSIQSLLRFQELGIEYVGEYPGGEFWITDDLVVRHNPPNVSDYAASVIVGHTHRAKASLHTFRGKDRTIAKNMYEIGCLCSLDTVPDKSSLTRTRVPSDRGFVNGWSHAIAVVSVSEDFTRHSVELVQIIDGVAMFRGFEYGKAKD